MIEFIRLSLVTMETSNWYFFQLYVIFVWVAMLPRLFFSYLFHKKNNLIESDYPDEVTVVLTVFNEDENILRESLRSVTESLNNSTSKYSIITVIDGIDPQYVSYKKNNQYIIAEEYSTIILCTNARNKRKNIRAALLEAKASGVLYEVTLFLDSDTITTSKDTIKELLKPFSNKKVGGVTTVQRIHNPRTFIQKISNWLEDARVKSSMAACSYFNQVVCLPGRMYAVRTFLIIDKLDTLVNDTFSFFGLVRRSCLAGDDRMMTNFILQAGYFTVLSKNSIVTTSAPEGIFDTFKMWCRWGRSSQGYTLRSPWLLKYPFAFFVCWSDIAISLLTVYVIAIHWPYSIYVGNVELTLIQSLTLAFLGMMLTMLIRQSPHLINAKKDIWLLPLFAIIVTFAQFIRVWALFSGHKIGVWGTRNGADVKDKCDIYKTVYNCKRNNIENLSGKNCPPEKI